MGSCWKQYAGCVLFLFTFAGNKTMALGLGELWDFSNPELSEQRFREALETAKGDDALVLQTQIARTWGLRGNFDKVREILKPLQSKVEAANAEAQVRYYLEWGRSYASAAHSAESQTPENLEIAREAYHRAMAVAKKAELDGLAVDAIHMLAFVDTAPEDQVKWAKEALAVVEQSSQASAKNWEASVRNNLGYALHQMGNYEDALSEFEKAVELRKQGGNEEALRVAYWMVAWTLRAMQRTEEALEIQLRLEKESEAAGKPDSYVFEELEALYKARNDQQKAAHYAKRKAELQP